MLNLKGKTFDAVVVGDYVDAGRHGGVRVRIIGLTDSLDDKYQPVALPVVNGMTAVPTKDTVVKVYFDEGDIHQPKYSHVSATPGFLNEDYINSYPNIAVRNLGGDEYKEIHSRDLRETLTVHPSNSSISWNSRGQRVHDSMLAYDNTGYGAGSGAGERLQPVLTGGTVDTFTCTAFGTNQGSEYMFIPHVSKERVTGLKEPENRSNEVTSLTSDENSGGTALLVDEVIDFSPSSNKLELDDREIEVILISGSDGTSFEESVDNITTGNSEVSAHYVVAEDGMIVQCIDPIFASYMGSKVKLNDSDDHGINISSVSVLLINSSNKYTDKQYARINNIIEHIKSTFGEGEYEIFSLGELDNKLSDSMPELDMDKVVL